MMDDETIIRLAHKAAQDELSIAVFTVNELARFADLAFAEQTKAPTCPREMMEFFYICNGIELVCHLEYEAEEKGSFDEPAYPENITLDSAFHLGENIGHLLSDDVVEEIENAALAQLTEQFDDY